MTWFIKQATDKKSFELLVDSSLFNNTCVFKTAYLFLDKGYFFFRQEKDNLIVVCQAKPEAEMSAEVLLNEFANELLNTLLREKLAKANKKTREVIISSAIKHSLREAVFYEDEEFEDEPEAETSTKSIDDILKEIEEELSAPKTESK